MRNEILLPVDLITINGTSSVVSFKLPATRFTEPFSIDTLSRQFNILDTKFHDPLDSEKLVRPLHYDTDDSRVVLTPLDEFLNHHLKTEPVLPKKFVFHMSRCGSTLVTQMLATNERFHVLVEPAIINKLMDPETRLPTGFDRIQVFKATIKALEQSAPERAEQTIFKFRSWNSLYIPEMTDAFPETKWLFTHRNGLEVLASVLKDPPGWLRSRKTHQEYFEPLMQMESGEDVTALADDEYAIRLLGAFCKTAVESKSEKGRFLEYTQIKQGLPIILSKDWNTELTDAENALMLDRSVMYSKDPEKNQKFTPDSEIKRSFATEHQRELADLFIESERKQLISAQPSWTRELRPRLI